MKTLISAVVASLLFAASPAFVATPATVGAGFSRPAQATQKVDVTGKWEMTVNTDQGARPGTLTISRTGDALAGTISSPQGEIPVDIALKEKAITISMSVQTQNGAIDITMNGTVDGDQMSGQLSMGDRGNATWSAKRAAPPSGQNPPPNQQKPAATMTGTWAFEVQHSAGTSTPTVTITQTGEKLTGKYVGTYGESVLTGSITENKFSFNVEVGTEQKVTLAYTGTLDGDTVKGNVTMGEMGEGTFTGKRQ
jgi:hypothetical protein